MSLYKSLFDSDTLRQKLLWWVLTPMLILLLLNVALVYKFGHDSADRRHNRFLFDASKILLDQLRTNQGQVEFSIHSGAMNMISEDKKDQIYYSLSGWGQNFQFGYPDLPAPSVPLSETPIYYSARYAGRPIHLMAAVMPESDVSSGRVTVIVGKTLNLHEERAQEWIWRVLPANLFFMGFSGIMVWWGVGRGLRPLLQLRDEITHRSSLDLRPLPEDQVVAEVRPLIHGFNELMGRLDESLILKRRFIADATHQLRTPIAGIKAQVELALRLNDPDEIRYSLLQMHKATEHTAHLVNQLLLLARAEPDAQQQGGLISVSEMVALARQTTENWVYAALQKDIDLGFETTLNSGSINGDAFLLGEMLNNLLDNAIRYTQRGGCITVRITGIDHAVQLEVEDNGPGIPESQRERVFERFYRVLGTNQEGCGLGLSIVREIAHRHHAEIRLLSGAKGSGTLMRITFRTIPDRLT